MCCGRGRGVWLAYDACVLHQPPTQQGNCIVHHMFGHDVVQRVKAHYGDAFHTAHLEVRQCSAVLGHAT